MRLRNANADGALLCGHFPLQMNLPPGTQIGPYEVISIVGAGGMGEVYQARDTKLNRSVALKILPAAFASDPDRLARFKREAQVLAALNHPNIAAIYGFEENARFSPAMELVPGQTLAAHITSPMPVADVLPIARQIASALEAAHEQGIVHRDLKPANIKVRRDGTVKVSCPAYIADLNIHPAGTTPTRRRYVPGGRPAVVNWPKPSGLAGSAPDERSSRRSR